MYRAINKIRQFIITIVLAVIMAAGFFPAANFTAFAEESAYNIVYDKTDIEKDLGDIDLIKYPMNPLGTPQVVRFSEFCYSENDLISQNYGLYLYIYNPSEKEIKKTGSNTALMAVRYVGGNPEDYENIALTYLDSTSNNRFYKFKVTDATRFVEIAKIHAKSFYGIRRYDIAGIQFQYEGKATLEEYDVESTFQWSGYAKGCGSDSSQESNLTCYTTGLETINLDIDHTDYVTKNEKADYVSDMLNTVYFSVPERFFNEYGGLQKIKAEWHEYKTTPIFVTSDKGAYDDLKNWLGIEIANSNTNLNWRVLWEEKETVTLNRDYYSFSNVYNKIDPSNENNFFNVYDFSTSITTNNRIDWLFYKNDVKSSDDYFVNSNELTEYMKWYTMQYPQGENVLDRYSPKLFSESIDNDRLALLEDSSKKNGYICQEIDAGDIGDLVQIKDRNWWERLWNIRKTEHIEYDPIVVIDDVSDVEDSIAFAKKYFINDNDANTVFESCKKAIVEKGKFVLFRFAVTDYYASTARFDYIGNGMSDKDGYVSQSTVFLNFDIITLTFRKAGQYDAVIPVVANPIDVTPNLSAPDDLNPEENWLERLVSLITAAFIGIGMLILLSSLAPWLIPLIGKGIVWLIKLPFRLIKNIVVGIAALFGFNREE